MTAFAKGPILKGNSPWPVHEIEVSSSPINFETFDSEASLCLVHVLSNASHMERWDCGGRKLCV